MRIISQRQSTHEFHDQCGATITTVQLIEEDQGAKVLHLSRTFSLSNMQVSNCQTISLRGSELKSLKEMLDQEVE